MENHLNHSADETQIQLLLHKTGRSIRNSRSGQFWGLNLLVVSGIILGLFACRPGKWPTIPTTPNIASTDTKLAPPRIAGEISLEEALQRRRSIRQYSDQPLTEQEILQLLWAAQGITSLQGQRTAPSAGGLYPLELYAITQSGVYHYVPAGHSLDMVQEGDVRLKLYEAALKQDPILRAPLVIAITAVYARTEVKYGKERGSRYVHLEAGHAAQNLLLQAVSLGLGAVPIGAFFDAQVQGVLGLPTDHIPLYLIPVGHLP